MTVLQSYIESILMYGCVQKEIKKKTEDVGCVWVFFMRMFRMLLKANNDKHRTEN